MLARPFPPAHLVDEERAFFGLRFAPADGVAEWVQAHLLDERGAIHNPDHQHLQQADVAYLWASEGFASRMRTVIGTCEEVLFRCNAWQRGRQEQQLAEWFGRVPEYLITLDASYCASCPDADWCALVEHELYHIGHKLDRFGAPAFTQDGRPKLGIRGHDVEEFVGVVRRYGAGDPRGAVSRLVRAANAPAQVSLASIAGACGTCLLRAA